MKYKNIDKCRSCGGQLQEVFDLGVQHLSGTFKVLGESVPASPLVLVVCQNKDCQLVQLSVTCDPNTMYGEGYGYRSSLNKSMVTHLRSIADEVKSTISLAEGDVVIDIGSNDGTYLGFFDPSLYLLGVDPSADVFGSYYKDYIHRYAGFFSKGMLPKLPNKAKVITSFSMLYDLDEPVSFIADISNTLSDDGVWISEQSYLFSMLDGNSFDTVCHEHLEYYSLKAISRMLGFCGLRMFDVELNNVNGGSFRFKACKLGAPYVITDRARELLETESQKTLDAEIQAFISRVNEERDTLTSFLKGCRESGKKVVGIGASTKGNTLLQFYGLGPDSIAKIGEVNRDKFGKVTPGSNIDIVNEQDLLSENYDFYLVLPWHFREYFVNESRYKGKRLIFPLPNFNIVEL